jgi:hypothetical protein
MLIENSTIGGSAGSVLIDSVRSCSWIVNPQNFTCLTSKDRCNFKDVWHDKGPDVGTARHASSCHYDQSFDRTRIDGLTIDIDVGLGVDAGTMFWLYNAVVADQIVAPTYALDNFLHGSAAGTMNIWTPPPLCVRKHIEGGMSMATWMTTPQKTVIAARRNSSSRYPGILARGNDVTLPNNTYINITNPWDSFSASVVNIAANATADCGYAIFVSKITPLNESFAGTSIGVYIVDTMSRFNWVSPPVAEAIAGIYTPPGVYNETDGLIKVDCNATIPDPPLAFVIQDKEYMINPADMIVRDFGLDYTPCWSAFRGRYGSENEMNLVLGWPFLRNVAIALDDKGQWNLTSRPYYAD